MPILRSCITTELKKQTLKKGASFTLSGGGLLLAIAFLPFSMLKSLGVIAFFFACFLIALGLVPYRRLLLLELNPFELSIQSNRIVFYQKNRPLFALEREHIINLDYQEMPLYGIIAKLDKPLKGKIKVLTKKTKFFAHLGRWQKNYPEGILFFPYFTKHSFDELKSHLTQDQIESDHAF